MLKDSLFGRYVDLAGAIARATLIVTWLLVPTLAIAANPGDVVINEIMQNSRAVSDLDGEWIELYNTTADDIDINGWTIKDNSLDSRLIANGDPLIIPSDGYLVLARDGNLAVNGGVTANYVYSDFALFNGSDEVVLLDNNLIEIDRVEYDNGATFPDPDGASMALWDISLDNSLGEYWCTSRIPYGEGDGGTPGGPNNCAIWVPQVYGTPISDYAYVPVSGPTITWADRAGIRMGLDDARVYDNWTGVDNAPQLRFSLNDRDELGHLRDRDFAITTQYRLTAGYGDRFHAAICVAFGADDLLVWGPHGSGDPDNPYPHLRLRRPGVVDHAETFPHSWGFLKLKRYYDDEEDKDVYSAWYSLDGTMWTKAHEVKIPPAEDPLYVGLILKNWGSTPHSERVEFHYFDITHPYEEPTGFVYGPNVKYGGSGSFDPPPVHFRYNLSGINILLRIFRRVVDPSDPNAPNPHNTRLYAIHGTGGLWVEGGFRPFEDIYNELDERKNPTDPGYVPTNLTTIAPRFPFGTPHPYPDRPKFKYQLLRGEEDRILMDIHEDFVRERFPVDEGLADDRFYLLGHSGGGQYVGRFIMGHSRKLHAAVVSSPSTLAFPDAQVDWPFGIRVPDWFSDANPRFRADLPLLFDLPVAVINGDNDNLVDRIEEGCDGIFWHGHSRHDGTRKWVRQMELTSQGTDNIDLYLIPGFGHGFAGYKTEASVVYLFGHPSDPVGDPAHPKVISNWQYTFELDHQDVEVPLNPMDFGPELFHYFKFDRLDLPKGGVPAIRIRDRRFVWHLEWHGGTHRWRNLEPRSWCHGADHCRPG